ncbi:hypothetical protein cypCar_00046843 [Cyprinus carpio]|nr:hypothetical protein cypCar_00046843 [Cyprinus carpio]
MSKLDPFQELVNSLRLLCFSSVPPVNPHPRSPPQCYPKVVENSSPVSHLNIPQLVGTAEGKILVQTFDWQQHLTHHFRRLPQIKSYQHFSFDAKRPGVVLAKTHRDAQPVEYQLLRDGADLPPIDGLPVLGPPGLNIDRQTYLYEKIRPFCADEARDITCAEPRVKTQKRPQKRMRM